jgi:hypothetical protein
VAEWSFEGDIERYERLLAQVKSRRFWSAEEPGRPNADEFRRQVERLQDILSQLRGALPRHPDDRRD